MQDAPWKNRFFRLMGLRAAPSNARYSDTAGFRSDAAKETIADVYRIQRDTRWILHIECPALNKSQEIGLGFAILIPVPCLPVRS